MSKEKPKVEVLFKKSRRVHDSEFSMMDVKIIKEGQETIQGLVDLIQIQGNCYPSLNIDCYRDGWYRFWDKIGDASIMGSVLTLIPEKGGSS